MLGIGRRGDVAGDAEQEAKGVDGGERRLKRKVNFVEIRLQMLGAAAVMDTAQPCFEIGEHEVNDRQKSFGNLHVATFRNGGMKIASLAKRRVTAPVVGNDGGAKRNDALNEATQGFGTSVWHYREPNPTGVPSSPPLVEAAAVLALFNLDRTGDENHVVDTLALATSTAADVGFISFDLLSWVATNSILVGPRHAVGPQFVKNLESSFVASQSELSLELDGGHARRSAGNQVGRLEPHRERCVRTFHLGANREVAIVLAVAASQNSWAICKTIAIARRSATWADEPVAPSHALKVSGTRCLVREEALELRQRARKRQIASLKHANNHGRPTSAKMLNILPIVV